MSSVANVGGVNQLAELAVKKSDWLAMKATGRKFVQFCFFFGFFWMGLTFPNVVLGLF